MDRRNFFKKAAMFLSAGLAAPLIAKDLDFKPLVSPKSLPKISDSEKALTDHLTQQIREDIDKEIMMELKTTAIKAKSRKLKVK